MGVVPFTLHLKVKYPSRGQVEELVGSQSTARQCMVAAIKHQTGGESSASATRDLKQSRVPEFSTGTMAKGAKCKQLERVVIGNNDQKFF